MAIPSLSKPAGSIAVHAVVLALVGCGGASSRQPSQAPLKVQTANIAPAAQPPRGSQKPPAEPASEVSEVTRTKPRPVPCQLQITEQEGAVVLDFHAQKAEPEKVREQVKQLELFLNEQRGDRDASSAPQGRPEPATFAVRRILEAAPVAKSEPLDGGARLRLTPSRAGGLADLHARVLWHAADLLPGLPLNGKVCPDLPPQVEEATQAGR